MLFAGGVGVGAGGDGEKREDLQPHDVHFWADLQGGMACIADRPVLRLALVQLVGTYSIIAALTVLAVRLAEVMPELEPDQFGFLLAVASTGIGGGAFLVGRFGKHLRRSVWATLGALAMGVCLLALAAVGDRLGPSVARSRGWGWGPACALFRCKRRSKKKPPKKCEARSLGCKTMPSTLP
ncbi:MAG: MFS transporter [Oscillatoriales cyanobacterium SM2_1_8]|nr:MFS transporter [Oscillatoriales cyanobacterium SM2_1_8]